MLLTIDVGNTQTTIGLFIKGDKPAHCWRMATNRADTSDMIHARLSSFLQKDGIELTPDSHAAIASVVPAATRAWRRCLEALLGEKPFEVTHATTCGMEITLPRPEQIGADRVANAVAARNTYGSPVIVVDFGTATNIDVVDRAGRYRGGCISPGLMLSAEALFARAARLANVPVEAPAHTLGTGTEEALQAGLVIGAAAQAEGLVRRICAELNEPNATIVGTGGLARTVAGATNLFDAVDPDLTLRGIREIYLCENAS